MDIHFYKYQGTGNDFVIIDNRTLQIKEENWDVTKICDRKFGVGADGLILINDHDTYDFQMVYFNSDGTQSFCGNGSRCAVAFAKHLGIIEDKTIFLSTDGVHAARISENRIFLEMHPVSSYETDNQYFLINTGSPHYIQFVEDVATVNLVTEARKVRYNERFSQQGINVNYCNKDEDQIKVRTYERGVEDETLSCGTGVTAVALANHIKEGNLSGEFEQKISTPGGLLSVRFTCDSDHTFSHIYLIGPAELVFEGTLRSASFLKISLVGN